MPAAATFSITYSITGNNRDDAVEIAEAIAVEQTVEMPVDVVPAHLQKHIGQVSDLHQTGEKRWEAEISYQKSLVDGDTVQFLNILFGNSSLKPGISIAGVDLNYLAQITSGPEFGVGGIREKLGISRRSMSATALKPIGLSPTELADLAAQFTLGGIDIIKDDHGLANQDSAPFTERVAAVTEAIRKSEQTTGKKTLYFPNITGSPPEVISRYELAAELGADGVLLCPQLTGMGMLSELRNMEIPLPIMAHPSFSGSMVINPGQGILPEIYYGHIWRAFGADMVIYPNVGGRFSFTEETCRAINACCTEPISGIKSSLPVPGGGINRKTVPDWKEKYGPDVLFLIGGSLYRHPDGPKAAARNFQDQLEEI